MKYKVTCVKNKGKIDIIEFQKGKYVLHVPSEAEINLDDKLNISVSDTEDELPKKFKVRLLGSVIRKNKNYSLVSAGGLLCQLPELFEMDQTVYITLF